MARARTKRAPSPFLAVGAGRLGAQPWRRGKWAFRRDGWHIASSAAIVALGKKLAKPGKPGEPLADPVATWLAAELARKSPRVRSATPWEASRIMGNWIGERDE